MVIKPSLLPAVLSASVRNIFRELTYLMSVHGLNKLLDCHFVADSACSQIKQIYFSRLGFYLRICFCSIIKIVRTKFLLNTVKEVANVGLSCVNNNTILPD